jgi:hypothetical protein
MPAGGDDPDPGCIGCRRGAQQARRSLSAQLFVEGGADEIQHLNFIVLNFLFDTVKDTRGTTRFTAVAQHAGELGPDKPKVQEFIAFLKAHHTVLDPTMGASRLGRCCAWRL